MSFLQNAKDFFGLSAPPEGPGYHDDAYYEEPVYSTSGSSAYQPRYSESYQVNYRADSHSRPAEQRRSSLREDRSLHSEEAYTPAVVTVVPRSFRDAQDIGNPFRDGDAVIVELTDVEPKNVRRFIDFCAGLCLGLRGQFQEISRGIDPQRKVFALIPKDAEVSSAELRSIAHLA